MATVIPGNQATFTLQEVADVCNGELADDAWGQIVTTSVQTDSRRVARETLFVPLCGERFDAHDFLSQVQTLGAAATLASRHADVPAGLPVVRVDDTLRALGDLAAYHRKRWGRTLIAITGSAGKTTTKELTYASLCAASDDASILRTEGNLNNLIGVPMTLLSLTEAHRMAVVEMGTNRPGEIARLAQIAQPQVGVVTSVAIAHAEGLGSLAGVALEKTDLLRALPASGTAIYSADSEPLARAAQGVACRTMTFGVHEQATVRLEHEQLALTSEDQLVSMNRYRVPGLDDAIEIPMVLLGHGAAVDAAAALAVVVAVLGSSAIERAARGLQGVAPGAGRMRPVHGAGGCLIVDDTYNANPASMEASLHSVRQIAGVRGGRAFAVLGEMKELGEHSRDCHRALGRLCGVLELAGLVGYGAAMSDAVAAARETGMAHATLAETHAHACEFIAQDLQPEDVVLVKGSRSMTMEHVVAMLCDEGGEA